MKKMLRAAALVLSLTVCAALFSACSNNENGSESISAESSKAESSETAGSDGESSDGESSEESGSESTAEQEQSESSSDEASEESSDDVPEVTGITGDANRLSSDITVEMSDGSGFKTPADAVNAFYNALVAGNVDAAYSQFNADELQRFGYDEDELKDSFASLCGEITMFENAFDDKGTSQWYCLMQDSEMKTLDPEDTATLNEDLGIGIEEIKTIDLTLIQSTMSDDINFTFYGFGVMKIKGAWYPSLAYYSAILMNR